MSIDVICIKPSHLIHLIAIDLIYVCNHQLITKNSFFPSDLKAGRASHSGNGSIVIMMIIAAFVEVHLMAAVRNVRCPAMIVR